MLSQLSDLWSAVVQVINDLITQLVQILNTIWQTIQNIVAALVNIFIKLGSFFLHLWQDYIKPAIHTIIHDVKKVIDEIKIYADIYKSLILRIRSWFINHIWKWVQLVQQILSVSRVFLSALRLLGVKWAAKLDAELQKIQSYITDVLQGFLGTLNQLATWLNFVVDPLGIVRRDFFRNTLFGNVLQTRNAVNFGGDRYLSASEAANTGGDKAMFGSKDGILTRNADGSVNYSDASKRINQGYSDAWETYGNPKI